MKYRSRLYLFFIVNSMIAILVTLAVIQFQTRKALFKELQSKVIAVAATTASTINGEDLKKIQTPDDQKSAVFTQVRDQLRAARNANRTEDIYIKFLYITRPDPKDPKKFIFVVDPEENVADFSPVGTNNPGSADDKLYDHLMEGYSNEELVTDPWGTWLTGYSPIYDSQKKYVATVGADISAEFVKHVLNGLLYYGISAFIASFVFAMFAATFLARHASRAIEALAAATLEIGKGNLDYRVQLHTKDEFEDLANSMNRMCQELEENQRIKTGFARYVSKHVLEQIVKAKGSTTLEGEKRKVTVFFSDIRGFTRIAEEMHPEDVVSLLNEYFKSMLEIIFKHNGMLDKLIGDGIMAEFGAPLDDVEQEKNAVITALEMHETLQVLREKWKKEGKPQLDIGVGIHTGEAIVGSIGSEQRMEYTAIGDTVNVASRLEHITRVSTYPIIISETTYAAVKDQYQFYDLGKIELPGRDKPIKAYGLMPKGYKSSKS